MFCPFIFPEIVIVWISCCVLSIWPVSSHVTPSNFIRNSRIEWFSGAVRRITTCAVLWPHTVKSKVCVPWWWRMTATIVICFTITKFRLPRISKNIHVHCLCCGDLCSKGETEWGSECCELHLIDVRWRRRRINWAINQSEGKNKWIYSYRGSDRCEWIFKRILNRFSEFQSREWVLQFRTGILKMTRSRSVETISST